MRSFGQRGNIRPCRLNLPSINCSFGQVGNNYQQANSALVANIINLIKFIVFTKQMLQAPNLYFHPFVLKAHNSECQNWPFPLEIKSVKVNLELIGGFLFFAPSAPMG